MLLFCFELTVICSSFVQIPRVDIGEAFLQDNWALLLLIARGHCWPSLPGRSGLRVSGEFCLVLSIETMLVLRSTQPLQSVHWSETAALDPAHRTEHRDCLFSLWYEQCSKGMFQSGGSGSVAGGLRVKPTHHTDKNVALRQEFFFYLHI